MSERRWRLRVWAAVMAAVGVMFLPAAALASPGGSLKTGTVRAWGDNNFGQLGDGTTTNRTTPVPVVSLDRVTAIAGGGVSGYALVK